MLYDTVNVVYENVVSLRNTKYLEENKENIRELTLVKWNRGLVNFSIHNPRTQVTKLTPNCKLTDAEHKRSG